VRSGFVTPAEGGDGSEGNDGGGHVFLNYYVYFEEIVRRGPE